MGWAVRESHIVHAVEEQEGLVAVLSKMGIRRGRRRGESKAQRNEMAFVFRPPGVHRWHQGKIIKDIPAIREPLPDADKIPDAVCGFYQVGTFRESDGSAGQRE